MGSISMKKSLIATVFTFIAVLAFSQERIAVFPFEDMDKVFTGNELRLFYRNFSNVFADRSPEILYVVPRQEVENLFGSEYDFQLSEFSARDITAEMERVLNGTQILSGLIGRRGRVC